MPVKENRTTAAFSFRKAIPPSVRKALIAYWGSEDIVRHPEILVELGPEAISRISRIGRKSLNKIALALNSFGYIESSGLWLAQEK